MSPPFARQGDRRIRFHLNEFSIPILFGTLLALSPLSSGHRLAASVAVGLMGAVGLFGYRAYCRMNDGRLASSRSPEDSSSFAKRPFTIDWQTVTIGGLLVALMLPTMIGLWPWYTESVWRNGHGLLLPLLIAAVAKVSILRRNPISSAGIKWGLAPLLFGLSLVVLDAGIKSLHVALIGLPFVVLGVILLFYGKSWARALATPTLLLLFFLPIASGLSSPLGLPVASAMVAEWLLSPFDMLVIRDRVSLTIDLETLYFVSTRCGGFSIVYGGLALSIAIGSVLGSWRCAAILVASLWPLTCIANGIRMAGLIVICEHLELPPTQTAFHGLSGVFAYVTVSAALILMAGPIARQRLLAS